MAADQVVSRDDAILSRSLAGATYLFRAGWNEVLVLEGLGDWLWQSISPPCSVADLALDVSEVLGRDYDEAVAEISPLVSELAALGAVQIGSVSGP